MRINKPEEKLPEVSEKREYSGRNTRAAEQRECFGDSLRKSIGQEETEAAVQNGIQQKDILRSSIVQNGSSRNVEIDRISRRPDRGGAKETAVRNISYNECDGIRINILDGYTLKAKIDERDGENIPEIYVEMNCDTGDTKACLFEAAGLESGSGDVMERLAYEIVSSRK